MAKNLKSRGTSFQKISLSLNGYKKSKVSASEISLNGNLYDVRSIHISGNKIELLVINDKQEKNILDAIKGYFNAPNQSNKKLPLTLKQLLAMDYLSEKTEQISLHFFSLSHLLIQPGLKFNSISQNTTSPPPRSV
jgi:hypothetical protein